MRNEAITHEYCYTVLFHRAAEGAYLVTCPTLPGLMAQGNSLAEARLRAADAIRCYLECLRKHGVDFPVEHYWPRALQIEVALDLV